ncbi:L-amino acid N-acyltransferase YncA [Zhouia amylolytica]|uniref:L-amino acid N-acyltransferase YncA n=1 Tax=Zhouia amylolytica TaxID=376730 RepID=A0A1I6PCD3_9FLAO|nr:GNAT family N-acetyltransferase [Zhouia amylolytica]MCQ0111410.1 GNAT family N-acetyltransferase [Zhouia amylolytica]SFS37748.1 L-amino acid N-acyltransferase YncA [Zhouia amylolytica]
MDYTIRQAHKEDMCSVRELIQELADFEKEPNAVEVTVEDLIEDGFGAHPAFHCFVAEVNGKIVGMALVYQRYSTWKGKTVHLEDLIVSEKMRGTGLGSALFTEVIKYGHQKGVKRIEWAVLDWNEPAITFYEKNGADVMRDWDTVQMNEQAIKNFIEQH